METIFATYNEGIIIEHLEHKSFIIISFIIIMLIQLLSQRLFQCIVSCSACFEFNDKVGDVLKGRQNDPKIIYEYARMDNAKNISKVLFTLNIISVIVLSISIILIIVLQKQNLLEILLLAYSIFQLPIFLIAIITVIPIIKNYKIYFFTRYYNMGELVRRH